MSILYCFEPGSPRGELERATEGSSGYDLRARISRVPPVSYDDSIFIRPGSIRVIPTGLYLAMRPGMEAQVRPRSGLASKGLVAVLGTIDSDYRGEIGVILINHSELDCEIRHGDRIAQLVFAWVENRSHALTKVTSPEDMSQTNRGARGFGSTGHE